MRSDVGDVSDPGLGRLIVLELTLQLIGCHQCLPAHFEPGAFVATHGLDVSRLHEPGHPVLATSQASFAQFTEDAGLP